LPLRQGDARPGEKVRHLREQDGIELPEPLFSDFLRELAVRVALVEDADPVEVADEEALRVIRERLKLCAEREDDHFLLLIAQLLCAEIAFHLLDNAVDRILDQARHAALGLHVLERLAKRARAEGDNDRPTRRNSRTDCTVALGQTSRCA
jgi:hypothetical protein